MEFFLNMISAFLGGAFALLGQWYVFRNEKYSTRRKTLYYLLEIYGNIYRLKKIKSVDFKYNQLLKDLGVSEKELKKLKSKIMAELNQEVISDVFDELDELNEQYPKIMDELSKENPTLAFQISDHAKSLDKMIGYFDRVSSAIKSEIPRNEHRQIDEVFEALFQNNFIDIVVDDIHDSIYLVSNRISYFESRKVKKLLEGIHDLKGTDTEIEERVKSVIEYFQSQEN